MERISAKELAEILGFTTTNLKHYASLLEQNGLEVYRNTRNHREYTQQDVKILRTMQYLNREKSMPLDEAASFVMSSDTDIDAILAQESTQMVATNDANISVLKQESDNTSRLLEQKSMLEMIEKRMDIFQKMLPSPEQQKLDRFNMLIAERKVIRKLEKEALNLWCDKPLEKRLIKVGWFRKIEDIDGRDRFVKEYVDEHFDNCMKKEYGID